MSIPSDPVLRKVDTLDISNADQIRDVVELIKQRDTVRELTTQLRREAPLVYDAMIGERDRYTAQSLLQTTAAVTVGVVGMAHMDGIETQLGWQKKVCGGAI